MEKLNILKSLIDELQNASDNKCGTSIIKLMDLTNLTYPEIRPILRQLFEDNL